MRRRPPGLGFGIGFRLNQSSQPSTPGEPPATPYLGIVASRSHSPNYVTTSQNQVMSSVGFDWAETVASVQLLIPTFYCPNGIDLIAAGSVTYHASIEYPLGTFTEVRWGGNTTVTVTGGASIDTGLSDAIAINAVRGERAKFHCYATVASGGGIAMFQAAGPEGRWTAGGDASILAASGVTDQVMSGGVTHGGNATFIFPVIAGMTTRKTIAAIGDSTTMGSSMTALAANGQNGEVAIFFGKDYGVLNLAVGGTQLGAFNSQGEYRRRLAQLYCTHVINHYQKNDFRAGNGNKPANRMIKEWQNFPLCFSNKVIMSSTVGPVSTSSNTVPDGNNAARNTLNAAIVAGHARYSGAAFDLGGLMESGGLGSTGLWVSGYSQDGLHANDTGQAALLASGTIDPATAVARGPAATTYSPVAISTSKVPMFFDIGSLFDLSTGGQPCVFSRHSFNPAGSPTLSATSFAGAPGVTCNGSSQGFFGDSNANALTNGAPAVTIAALFYPTSTPAGDRPLFAFATNNASNDRAGIYVSAANKAVLKYRRLDADSVTSITSTATVPNNTPSLIVAVFNPTSNSVSLFINGVADVTGTFASSGNFSATNSAAANIAAFNTLLASVLNALFAADKAVTTDERQKLEGFLAHNAGLAASLLPVGHPYLAAPPVAN